MISDTQKKNIDQIRTWYAEKGSEGLSEENCNSFPDILIRSACAAGRDGIIDAREKQWSIHVKLRLYFNMIGGHDGRDLLRLRAAWFADHARTLWHRFDDSAEERLGYLRELISIRRSTSFSPEDSKKIATHLTELMNDKSETDPGLHLAAMEALDAMGDTGRINLPMLDHLQNSPDARVVEGAAALTGKAIASCDDDAGEEIFQRMVEALKSPAPEVRLKAVDALGIVATSRKYHAKASIDALTSAVSDKDPEVRLSALSSLCACGAPAKRALPTVLSMAEEEELSDEEILAVVEAAARIDPTHPGSVDLFVGALAHPSETIAASAADALIRSGTNARPLIFAAAQQGGASVLPWAIRIFKGTEDAEGVMFFCEALSHAFRKLLGQRRWAEVRDLFLRTTRACDEATLSILAEKLVGFILLDRGAWDEAQVFLKNVMQEKGSFQKTLIVTLIDLIDKDPTFREISKELLSCIFSVITPSETAETFKIFLKRGMWKTTRRTLEHFEQQPEMTERLLGSLKYFLIQDPRADQIPLDLLVFTNLKTYDDFGLSDDFFQALLKRRAWDEVHTILDRASQTLPERGSIMQGLLSQLSDYADKEMDGEMLPLHLVFFVTPKFDTKYSLHFRHLLNLQAWDEARSSLESLSGEEQEKAAYRLTRDLISYTERHPNTERVPSSFLAFVVSKSGDPRLFRQLLRREEWDEVMILLEKAPKRKYLARVLVGYAEPGGKYVPPELLQFAHTL